MLGDTFPDGNREAVAELVGGLVEELADMFHQVVVAAGKAAPVLEGRADLLDGKGGLAVGAGDIRAFYFGEVIGIEFYPVYGAKPRLRC
jgi:hypothetical protein